MALGSGAGGSSTDNRRSWTVCSRKPRRHANVSDVPSQARSAIQPCASQQGAKDLYSFPKGQCRIAWFSADFQWLDWTTIAIRLFARHSLCLVRANDRQFWRFAEYDGDPATRRRRRARFRLSPDVPHSEQAVRQQCRDGTLQISLSAHVQCTVGAPG